MQKFYLKQQRSSILKPSGKLEVSLEPGWMMFLKHLLLKLGSLPVTSAHCPHTVNTAEAELKMMNTHRANAVLV